MAAPGSQHRDWVSIFTVMGLIHRANHRKLEELATKKAATDSKEVT